MSPIRAAIYARYSTELQSSASIHDQVRVCRTMCEENGWRVVEIFADEAMSGASHLRPGYQAMQQAARDGHVDVIVAEALDRISRDQEHIAALHKQMRFLDVKIFTRSEGEINEMHIGLGGTMSALFLKQLAQKTHRGLEGRVRAGKSAGGISYGYKAIRTLRADGTVTTGDRVIVEEEAQVVRRIFEGYASGLSARSLAAALNAEGIGSPENGKGAGTWGPSTISGNWKRGTGILNNELYIGRLVWNRQRFIKYPSTGKRQARPNPPEDWVIEEVGDLRIIDDDLWQRVKVRQCSIREDINPAGVQGGSVARAPERARRPTYLLSGLVVCDSCGATYSLINKTRYGCSGSRNKGDAVCTNRATIARVEVEARVLGGLKDRLMHPDLVSVFVEEYRRAWNAAQAGASEAREKTRRELAQIEKKIAGIVQAITDGMYHPSMKTKMDELETRKGSLVATLAETREPPALRLHPRLTDLYRERIGDLVTALSDPSVKLEATEALRGLVSEIRMVPDTAAPGGHRIELVGELATILSLSEGKGAVSGGLGLDITKPPRLARAGSGTMVAGTGNRRLECARVLPIMRSSGSTELLQICWTGSGVIQATRCTPRRFGGLHL